MPVSNFSRSDLHEEVDDKHVYMHERMCAHPYWFSIICIFDPSGTPVNCEFTVRANINESVCVCVGCGWKEKGSTHMWICVLTCQWRIILQMRPKVSLWFPSTMSVPPMFTRSTWDRRQWDRHIQKQIINETSTSTKLCIKVEMIPVLSGLIGKST